MFVNLKLVKVLFPLPAIFQCHFCNFSLDWGG